MIFSVGLDRFLTAVAVSPTLRTAHRGVVPHHIKVRILSPRQVGYELRWAGSGFSGFKLHLGSAKPKSKTRLQSAIASIKAEPAADVVIKAIKDADLPAADRREIARGIDDAPTPDLKATLAVLDVDAVLDEAAEWDTAELKEIAKRVATLSDRLAKLHLDRVKAAPVERAAA